MSEGKLSNNLSTKQKKFVRERLEEDLSKLDLGSVQAACKSFGPFNYNNTTRKKWFEENKHRLGTGRKIIKFVDTWAKSFRKEGLLSSVNMTVIRKEILEIIRKEMDAQGLSINKLNEFKLATFRTLVSWADDPSKLEEGPYEGMKNLPEEKHKRKTSPRGRKSAKGGFKAPEVDLVRSFEIKGKTLALQIAMVNNYIHPYQNVELDLEFDSQLEVQSVKDYSWVPSERKIRIGFLPASLEVAPSETIIDVNLRLKSDTRTFTVDGVIHYDNTEKGIREAMELDKSKIKI